MNEVISPGRAKAVLLMSKYLTNIKNQEPSQLL
jgi:hypothetical protein